MTATVIIPAMGVPARHYARLAERLAAHGHDVRTVALPGDGDQPRPSRRHDAGYDDIVTGAVAATVDTAREDHGGAPVLLVGHSLGGHLALLYAATRPDAVAAVALPAAGTNHWRAFPVRTGLRFLAISQAAAVVASILGSWPGERVGFGGRQPARLIRDWARLGRTGRFSPAGARRAYREPMAALQLPVLSLTLAGDDFAPRTAAESLLATAPRAEVSRLHLDAEAFTEEIDHLRWLRCPSPVADAIAGWSHAVSPPASTVTPTT